MELQGKVKMQKSLKMLKLDWKMVKYVLNLIVQHCRMSLLHFVLNQDCWKNLKWINKINSFSKIVIFLTMPGSMANREKT